MKKKHRGIKFNQKVWLKPYVDMNREVTKKNGFGKKISELMNNAFFGKTMNNVRRHRDIKLATTETRYYLVSEPNYHTTKKFSWKVVNYRNKENINIHD